MCVEELTLQALRSGLVLVSAWSFALQHHALQLSAAAWIAQLIP